MWVPSILPIMDILKGDERLSTKGEGGSLKEKKGPTFRGKHLHKPQTTAMKIEL